MRKLEKIEMSIEYINLSRTGWDNLEIFKRCPHLRSIVIEKSLWSSGLPVDRIIRTDRPYPFTITYDPIGYNPFRLASMETEDFNSGYVSTGEVEAISLLNYEYQGNYWEIQKKDPEIAITTKKIKDLVWYLYLSAQTPLAQDIRDIVDRSSVELNYFRESLDVKHKADIPLKRDINRIFTRLTEMGFTASINVEERSILIKKNGGDFLYVHGRMYDDIMDDMPENVSLTRYTLYKLNQEGYLEAP